jgi:acetolactate synthase-1/3 small subunit
MTITMVADEEKADSFARLLKRTVDVIEITRMNWDRALLSELAQIKIRTDGLHERRSVLAMVGTWGARVIEITEKTVCVEITGSPGKIDECVEMAAEFGIVGVSRTGVTALAKG